MARTDRIKMIALENSFTSLTNSSTWLVYFQEYIVNKISGSQNIKLALNYNFLYKWILAENETSTD